MLRCGECFTLNRVPPNKHARRLTGETTEAKKQGKAKQNKAKLKLKLPHLFCTCQRKRPQPKRINENKNYYSMPPGDGRPI